MRYLVFAIFCVVAYAAVAAADSYEEAEFAYDRGEYTKAARLFRPLAEAGNPAAQFHLGLMHERGWGVQKDYAAALKWFRKATAQGYAGPQSNLGLLYERGRGVRRDFMRAHMWYDLAAAMLSGDDATTAKQHRDQIASRMTPAEVEKAQEMARRCKQSQFKECD
jgi:TPR repeat protein